MRKALVIGVLGLGLLGGCFPKLPDGNGDAAYTWNDPVILKVGNTSLIGQMTTITGTGASGPSYYRQVQQFEASDGFLTCTTPLNEKWGGGQEGIFAGKSYNTKLTCSDGSEGAMRISVDTWKGNGFANHGFRGVGIGKLSNGTKLRLTFGPSVTVINTDF